MFNSGFRGKRAGDNQGTVNLQTSFVQNLYPQPTITGWSISGTDDTALNPAGGQTVLVNGTGFASGVAATVNGSTISPVTLVNPTQISFTSPALAGGSYSLIVYNSTGGAAILVPGLVYSSVPTYTTAAGSIGNIYETNSISTQVIATSDSAITYSLASGSLPSGATLYANGVITGTAPVDSASTTYTFGVTATDAELQDVTRTFTLTINTDTVTWNNPSSNTSIILGGTLYSNALSATSAAGKSITYTANSLPTGLTLNTETISGTPTVNGTTTTLLTATAATTNRTSQRTITWIVELNDVYFNYVTLLLSGETSVTPFISDASTNSFGLTINGDTKPVLFNPYTPGYYSNYFDGSGDYLTPPMFNFGTTDFTVEAWVYPSVSGGVTPPDNQILYISTGATTRLAFRLNSVNKMDLYLNAVTPGVTVYTSNTILSINTWYHLAAVRQSGSIKLFVNGILDNTPTASVHDISDNTTYSYIGSIGASTQPFNGYISNFRITSTAVYTGTFTLSTLPLTAISGTRLLTCQSNRFIDNSTNAYSITRNGDVSVSPAIPFTPNSSYRTYGSAYFDGTGDYIQLSDNAAFDLGTGNFTIEFWFMRTATPTVTYHGIVGGNGSGFLAWSLYYTSGNEIMIINTSGSLQTTTGASIANNIWYHVAAVKNSGVLKMFINGIERYSAADSSTYDITANGWRIGDDGGHANGWMNGYISDLRIVKGTAVYTSAFTPPTQPLTAIANTSLLTLQYNGGATNQAIIDNSSFNNIITRSGNTSQGSFSPYSVTGWSNYFDGTGDYLTLSNNTLLGMGSGNFTVEFWLYQAALSNYRQILDVVDGNSAGRLILWVGSDGTLSNLGSSGTTRHTTSSGAIVINTWTHVALVRSSGTTKFYINGTQSGSNYTDSTNYTCTTGTVYIGINSDGSTYPYLGYISNFRMIKGTAVYTSAFTPSTTPLTAITNTSILTCQSNRFIDNSLNSFAITRNGDTSVQALDPFGSVPEAVPISYSNYFDGTDDNLSFPGTLRAAMGGGFAGNLTTMEAWIYTATNGNIFGRYDAIGENGRFYWSVSSNNLTFLWTTSTGAATSVSSTGSLVISNQWNHVAITIDATTASSSIIKMFINGTLSNTFTSQNLSSQTAFAPSNPPAIGYAASGTSAFLGYISNFRVVTGSLVYTANFTPSTTPLTAIANTSLLTCQSTTMIDNSANRFTVTANGDTKPRILNPFGYTSQTYTSYTPSLHGGSIYLDGTGDSLTAPDNAFNLTTTIWCIEYWIYPTVIASGYYGLWALSTSGFRQGIYTDSGTHYLVVLLGGGGYGGFSLVAANKVITINNWQHIALTSDGTTIRQFYNGVLTSTGSVSTFSASAPTVGSWGGANYFTGYMSDFRITKGSAIYTSNFVPPTTSVTAIPNTTLLLNFNNGGIIDLHGSNVLETLGNTQLSTSVKKYGTSSIYFDGTGDYLYSPPSINYAMGSGNFTIEFWYYPISQNPAWNPNIMGNYNATWTSNKWAFHAPHAVYASKYSFWVNNYASNSAILVSTSNITNGAWAHIAITRSGSTWRIFVNGTIEATTTSSVALDGGTAASMDGFYVGANFYSGEGGRYINAYMDDLRITKGYARYTSNFTPPTSALGGR